MNHHPDRIVQAVPESIDHVVTLGETAPSKCPKCLGEMELGQLRDHMVIVCRACQGVLIQSQIFGEIVQALRKDYTGPESKVKPLDPSELTRRIKCPGCRQLMEVHPYHGPSNTVIDSCSKCWFTFLDYGELARIEQAPGRR